MAKEGVDFSVWSRQMLQLPVAGEEKRRNAKCGQGVPKPVHNGQSTPAASTRAPHALVAHNDQPLVSGCHIALFARCWCCSWTPTSRCRAQGRARPAIAPPRPTLQRQVPLHATLDAHRHRSRRYCRFVARCSCTRWNRLAQLAIHCGQHRAPTSDAGQSLTTRCRRWMISSVQLHHGAPWRRWHCPQPVLPVPPVLPVRRTRSR